MAVPHARKRALQSSPPHTHIRHPFRRRRVSERRPRAQSHVRVASTRPRGRGTRARVIALAAAALQGARARWQLVAPPSASSLEGQCAVARGVSQLHTQRGAKAEASARRRRGHCHPRANFAVSLALSASADTVPKLLQYQYESEFQIAFFTKFSSSARCGEARSHAGQSR